MDRNSRREFLSNVGKGMLVAGVGPALAGELGISTAWAEEESGRLTFGPLEPLVEMMQQTPVDQLQPAVFRELQSGTDLKTVVAAGALANARCFGGEDYVGFHTMMALMPAWQIAEELPESERALPVLKVLYRNTARMQATGRGDVLRPIEAADLTDNIDGGERLLGEMRGGDLQGAEQTFAALVQGDSEDAYNDLQHIVRDAPDVHRVTLAWKAWDVLRLTGPEYAQPLLRQSVRYCVDARTRSIPALSRLVARLLDEYKLLTEPAGSRRAEPATLDRLARTIFASNREQAAEAAAAALAEGLASEDVSEALALAANLLVLHDPGRESGDATRPEGSVHGASVGVHASDAANSWRNIARVTNRLHATSSLIVGAWHTAGQKSRVTDDPYPFEEEAQQLAGRDAEVLLAELTDAIESSDQARSCAVVQSWQQAGNAPDPIFDMLRRYAVSEDGALHAEKYFRTVTEEFAAARPEFRWRHLIGLARVSASQYGWPAPGREQARELLAG